MLPLLIDLSGEEFEKLAPTLCRMFGASPLIEYRRSEPLADLINRLTLAAQQLEIRPTEKPAAPRTDQATSCTGQIWATDANQIDILDLDRVLFRNDTIDDFLNRKHRHFISATKGFGKTLLLTCKRHLLTQLEHVRPAGHHDSRGPALPRLHERDAVALGEVREAACPTSRPPSGCGARPCGSPPFRTHRRFIDPQRRAELEAFPPRIRRWLRGAKIEPTVVFKELTTLRVSELNRLIDRTENFLDQKMRQIHGGTCFFIDKVDQAIRHSRARPGSRFRPA